jgi:hypothetical protein
MAPRESPLTYIAGAAFALLCLWAAPAMSIAGFVGIIVGASVALSARAASLHRIAMLAFAIVLVSIVQIVFLQLRVGSTLPYQALWAFVALVSAVLLVSYVTDRRRDA